MIATRKATYSPQCVKMERDQGLENSWYPDLETAEPHFDDERTILSAQPVVPLKAVSKVQTRRRLIFVGAFVVAAMLGAVAALALVRVRQPTVAGSTGEASAAQDPVQEPVAQTAGSSETSEFGASGAQPGIDAESGVESVPVTRHKRRVHRSASDRPFSTPDVKITTSPGQQSSDDGEARLVGQWREQRQRRVNRKPDNHHRSDLFRIREIFEGPRASRRPDN